MITIHITAQYNQTSNSGALCQKVFCQSMTSGLMCTSINESGLCLIGPPVPLRSLSRPPPETRAAVACQLFDPATEHALDGELIRARSRPLVHTCPSHATTPFLQYNLLTALLLGSVRPVHSRCKNRYLSVIPN